MTPNGEGCEYPKCKVPVSPFAETIKVLSAHEAVIYMKFGPAGVDKKTGLSKQALYYVSRDGDMRGVHKIEYTGTANRGPRAEIYADPTFGFKPLRVNFDGTGSVDPDGDELTYEWDVDGDGVVDSTSSKTVFEYNESGTHYAILTVKDGKGGKAQTEIRIEVENTPPTPVILTPAEGTTFHVDQEFELIGTATDGEEGQLDDTSLTWEVRQHHNTHYHPWVDPETPGNNLVIKAPEPEDFDASLTSYLEILLTATDSQGLSTTVSRKIYPRKVEVLIDSVPRGLEVIAYGDVHVTPKKVITWDNHVFEVEAYDQTMDGSTYTFDSWNDGGEQTHDFEALPVGNGEVREDGVSSKNVIIARFFKDGIPVKDDSSTSVELPSDETDATTMEPTESVEDEDEGELAALEKEEGIADLSDFVVAIRLNSNDSTVRRRHLSEAELISYLDDNLKSFTAKTLKKELKAIAEASEDISYAKPNRVRLTLKGRTFREGKNYKAVFGGVVFFKAKQEDQRLPSEAALQSMQLQAMDELSHQVFYDIKSNVPEARVATVLASSDVPAKLYNIESPTEPSGSVTSSSTGSKGNSSDSMGSKAIIILSCSIVAGLAIIAISAFLIIRGRRRPRQSDKVNAIAADTDDDALVCKKKKEETTSLVGKKEEESTDDEEAQDLVNNTMVTDNESLPASPSRDVPAGDSDSAAEDEDGSVVALAPNPIMKYMRQVEDAKPEAASDDEASTARSSVDEGLPAEGSEVVAPVEGEGDDGGSTASKSVAATSLHAGEMIKEEGTGTPEEEGEQPTAASDDEASTASTRFGAVEE